MWCFFALHAKNIWLWRHFGNRANAEVEIAADLKKFLLETFTDMIIPPVLFVKKLGFDCKKLWQRTILVFMEISLSLYQALCGAKANFHAQQAFKKTVELLSSLLSNPNIVVMFFNEGRFGLRSVMGRCRVHKGKRKQTRVKTGCQSFYV